MSKAFTREDDESGTALPARSSALVPTERFHLTREGARRLKEHPEAHVRAALDLADVLDPAHPAERALLGVIVHARSAGGETRVIRLVSHAEQLLLGDGCSPSSPLGRAPPGRGGRRRARDRDAARTRGARGDRARHRREARPRHRDRREEDGNEDVSRREGERNEDQRDEARCEEARRQGAGGEEGGPDEVTPGAGREEREGRQDRHDVGEDEEEGDAGDDAGEDEAVHQRAARPGGVVSGDLHPRELVVLGCGYAGLAVAREARMQGLSVLVHARREERAADLAREGFKVWHAPTLEAAALREVIEARERPAVLIAFPPDARADEAVASALKNAARGASHVVYLSTTGVYGDHRGKVDDSTPVADDDDRARRWLDAEAGYLRVEATVLRCSAIYGPDRGVHTRVLRGEHKLPGDGAQTTSRIHVFDLARLVLACMAKGVPARTYVVGDRHPAPHREVVEHVCQVYGVPFPPSIPLEEAHPSLRADRAVDPSGILALASVSLRYPSYREGMAPTATGLSPR